MYFDLHRVRAVSGSPFYCIDEIDAALDIRACSAVAALLQQLSSRADTTIAQPSDGDGGTAAVATTFASSSQFIVVSHRPQMYQTASRLIGVFGGGKDMDFSSTSVGWQSAAPFSTH